MRRFSGQLPSAHRKTAAFPPQGQSQNAYPGDGATTRNIPKDHSFDSRALKPLSKALWASTVALGHSLTAYRHLSRIKSATVSPDGSLGGRGYVMKLAEMRQKLYEASEALSSISDTIFDEISAPHWKPKLAQLDDSDQEDVRRFIDEAQDVMEDPEADAAEEEGEIEDAPPRSRKQKVERTEGSLPDGGDAPAETSSAMFPKQASMRHVGLTDRAWVAEFYGNRAAYPSTEELLSRIYVKANSSEPVGEMPGGPRVNHIGPGTGNGEYGAFSEAETLPPADPWNADGGGISRREEGGEDYDYTSEWENAFPRAAAWKASRRPSSPASARPRQSHERQRRERLATAGIPDASSDDTKTDAWDFGIGYGARGQGAGGYENPSGEGNGTKGVEGPRSGLPGSWSQSSGDATHEVIEEKQSPRHAAYETLYGQGLLPQDVAGDVSRSDYYPGAKDNGASIGNSDLPGQAPAVETGGQSLLNTFYTQEDVRTPYARFDYSTRNSRDPVLATGQVK